MKNNQVQFTTIAQAEHFQKMLQSKGLSSTLMVERWENGAATMVPVAVFKQESDDTGTFSCYITLAAGGEEQNVGMSIARLGTGAPSDWIGFLTSCFGDTAKAVSTLLNMPPVVAALTKVLAI